LLKKHLRNGGKSIADLTSELYEPTSFGKRIYSNRETPKGEIEMRPPKKTAPNLNQTLPHPPSISKNQETPINPKNRKYLEISNARYTHIPKPI
jgi:hypothetical protein